MDKQSKKSELLLNLNACATCAFTPVRSGQLDLKENETVKILTVFNGYAKCQKSNGKIGEVPTYYLEMNDCPGTTFADQIKYRRLWYAVVDERKLIEYTLPNPDILIHELRYVPELATFAQIEHNCQSKLFFNMMPFFIEEFEDTTIRSGDILTLSCQVKSESKIRIKWKLPYFYENFLYQTMNEKKIEDNIFLTEDNKVCNRFHLKVVGITTMQSGQYTLIAENDTGNCCTNANVIVLVPPSPPLDFFIDIISQLLQLRWKTPKSRGNAKTIWYTVEYKKLGYDRDYNAITGISNCKAKIFDLLPDTQYFFRVYAYNEAFRSNPTCEILVHMPK